MACALRMSEAAAMALHAMGFLAARPEEPQATPAIARTFGVSEAHLSKVMQRLAKAGLVRSVRGPRGGFSLASDPRRVVLLDVFEAIEGKVEAAGCLFAVPQCDGMSCILGSFMLEANRALLDRLSGTNLAEISRILVARGIVDPGRRGDGAAGRGPRGRTGRGSAGRPARLRGGGPARKPVSRSKKGGRRGGRRPR